jgi:hypothetical protein
MMARAGLQGWFERGSEDAMWEFILDSEELGLTELQGAVMPAGVYTMPQRSYTDRGEVQYFHLLSEATQTQQREV